MGVRAAFFDVGDTLVEGKDPDYRAREREALVRRYGERAWYDAFLQAKHDPGDHDLPWRQDTLGIVARWLRGQRIPLDDIAVDTVRSVCSVRSTPSRDSRPAPRDGSVGASAMA